VFIVQQCGCVVLLDSQWLSVNLGVLICLECSGVHSAAVWMCCVVRSSVVISEPWCAECVLSVVVFIMQQCGCVVLLDSQWLSVNLGVLICLECCAVHSAAVWMCCVVNVLCC